MCNCVSLCSVVLFSHFLFDNANLDLVTHSLEQELSLEVDHFSFLGRLEGPHQCLVIIGHGLVVKEFSKGRVGFSINPDPTDIDQELGAFLVETVLCVVLFIVVIPNEEIEEIIREAPTQVIVCRQNGHMAIQ